MSGIRLPESQRAVALVGLVYGGSVGGLFLAELLLARSTPSEVFGAYQLVRQTLPFAVVLLVFGLDQAITRASAAHNYGRIAQSASRSRILASLAAALLFASGLHYFLGLPWPWAALAGGALPGIVASELGSGLLRGEGKYRQATTLQQGYRLLLALSIILVLSLGHEPRVAELLLMLLASSCLFGFIGVLRVWYPLRSEANGVRVVKTGAAFALSMLSIAALDSLDLVVLTRQSASLSTTGEYAAAKLILTYPFISVASIGGIFLMPELIRHNRSLKHLYSVKATILFGGAAALFIVLTTRPIQVFLTQLVDVELSSVAIALLLLTGLARLVYVLPSATLGAHGSTRLIAQASLVGMLAPLILLLLMMPSLPLDGIEQVSLALAAATAYRLAVAVFFSRRTEAMNDG